jgi:hypothetical protein
MKAEVNLQFSHDLRIINAKDMAKDLIALDNMRLTMRRGSAARRALLFAEKYGVTPFTFASNSEKDLVKWLFKLGEAMAKLARRNGHPKGKPIDEFGREIVPLGWHRADHISFDFCKESVEICVDDLIRCAYLSFHFSKEEMNGECDNCGGVITKRAGSRFCSDYCRDVSKKKKMRDAAKKGKRYAVG